MNANRRLGFGVLGALLLAAALPAVADNKPAAAPAAGDEAQFEQRLEAAQKRLEQAAKEVAELSAGMAADQMREIGLHVGHGEPRAMIGVQLGEERAGGGVRVAGVSPGGAAADAGVKPGDVIISINGHRTATPGDVTHEVRALKPGDQARLEVERGGKREVLVVATRSLDPRLVLLGGDFNLPGLESFGPMLDDWRGGHGGGWGDIELCALSPDLGRYFGTDHGVLVVKAGDGALRLRDGDVIQSIDGRAPQGVSHALRILRSYQPGEHVTLAVLRDHKAQKLEISMPARNPHGMPPPPAPPAPPAAPAPSAAPVAPAAPRAPPSPSSPGADG